MANLSLSLSLSNSNRRLDPPSLPLTFPPLPTLTKLSRHRRRYAHSKIASIIHAQALHTRFHRAGISAYSLHPGIIHTNLQSKDPTWVGSVLRFILPLKILPGTTNAPGGAKTTLFCATSEAAAGCSGGYFMPPGKLDGRADKWNKDGELVERVWVESERMLREAGFPA